MAALRPCSRCLSNGKQDACVDVQHKKRGRPRLRDDSTARFDSMRPSHHPYLDLPPQRAPDAYTSRGALTQVPGGMMARQQPHPHFRTPTSATLAPRQLERYPDGRIYSPPPPLTTGYLEPVAYLTTTMEFAKVSPTFSDAIGIASIAGRRLRDVAASTEAEKIETMQIQLLGEQRRREPNYLPPILGHGPVLQNTGFSPGEVARFSLPMHDQLVLVGSDGYGRQYPFRMGLAKEGSFFFVIMLLGVTPRFRAPLGGVLTRNPASRDHQAAQPPRDVGAAQASPGSPYDPVRHGVGGSSQRIRSPMSLQTLASQAPLSVSPSSASSRVSLYGLSAVTPRYSGPTEQNFRGHAGPSGPGPTTADMASQQRFQLPPIRVREPYSSALAGGQGRPRDERLGRVDIDVLIDKPDDED